MLYVMFGLISPGVLEKEMNMWKEYDNENDDDTDKKRTTTFDKTISLEQVISINGVLLISLL